MGTNKRHHYNESFKRSAVDLCRKSDKTLRQVANDLGVSELSLHRWKKRYSSEAGTDREPMHAENERLRRENAELRQERDILKKSVAIFLKPQK